MFVVSSGFIGKFKIGDNVNYNLAVLAQLYDHFGRGLEDKQKLLCKPITILLISIIEAFLYDLHFRGRTFTSEGVANVARSWFEALRGSNVDEFARLIDRAKNHKLLGDVGDEFYSSLHELRKLRNRVHIQNEKNDLDVDDVLAFTPARKVAAEEALEKVAKYLAAHYPRPEHVQGHVADFKLPWREHYRL